MAISAAKDSRDAALLVKPIKRARKAVELDAELIKAADDLKLELDEEKKERERVELEDKREKVAIFLTLTPIPTPTLTLTLTLTPTLEEEP